jgi:hypothetical protein
MPPVWPGIVPEILTMRLSFLALSCLACAAPALADPLKVAKGMWSTSTDIYFSVTANGETIDVPSEHSTLDECWMSDQEVTIDESMASFFEGCTSAGSRGTPYSFDMDLTCDFDGMPMSGTAEFAVSKGGGQFSGRLFLTGGSEGVEMNAEGLLLGHRTGTCTAPQ